ncbi:MAG TPA: ZIP family metal transporter [candidate division Zixibacteria bacterium]|nr:ZIP family metal transporter [candidate division Zixibacteria bacterium]
MTVLLTIASVLAVSLVSLVGVLTLSMDEARVRALATFFVSFAVGALLGDAFIHLIPGTFEAFAAAGASLAASLLILAGMMAFFVVEKLLRHTHGVLHAHHHPGETVRRPELAAINVLGDAIHNFIDGLVIGASYLAGPTLGISTTIAVVLHEIPQELGDFGILVHSGLSVRRAVLLNLASASVAIVGAGVSLGAGTVAHEAVTRTLLPVTAGGFVYLAAADLIPELQHDRSVRALGLQTGLITTGIAVMGLLTFVE